MLLPFLRKELHFLEAKGQQLYHALRRGMFDVVRREHPSQSIVCLVIYGVFLAAEGREIALLTLSAFLKEDRSFRVHLNYNL